MAIQERHFIYKSDGAVNLKLRLFMPLNATLSGEGRSAALFFHGGRFVQGHPAQFYPHCRYLASRGMVAASAEYRLLSKNAASINDCLSDSRDAIVWLRSHIHEFGIDPARVVAGGGSAGANLAANAAFANDNSGERDGNSVSSRPDALILFSPAVIIPDAPGDLIDGRLYNKLAPVPKLPPMLLLHGSDDEIFAEKRMQEFCDQMRFLGNHCALDLYPGGKHGYFNYGRDENRPFYETLLAADKFLCELGFLGGSPTLQYDEGLTSLHHDGDWQS